MTDNYRTAHWIFRKNANARPAKAEIDPDEAAKRRAIADALSRDREDKRINEQTREVWHE